MAIKLKITQHKSGIGRTDKQQKTLAGLGLRGPHKTVTLQDTPSIRGMINHASYLLKVEE